MAVLRKNCIPVGCLRMGGVSSNMVTYSDLFLILLFCVALSIGLLVAATIGPFKAKTSDKMFDIGRVTFVLMVSMVVVLGCLWVADKLVGVMI